MINLIPKEEKKKKVKNFYYKVSVLFFAVMGASVFIAFIAILPSYFLSSAKNNAINEKLEMQKKQSVPALDQQTLLMIEDLNNKLDLIESVRNDKFIVSEKIINAIILRKIPNIKITDISYENNFSKGSKSDKAGRKVSIQGNAPSREILLLFRQALEDGAIFKQIDLPISNFVKGSDIKFYLSLVPE